MYIFSSFVIYSFANGHLGWFHSLAIVNCAAMNIDMDALVCSLVFILLGRYPEVVLLDHIIG